MLATGVQLVARSTAIRTVRSALRTAPAVSAGIHTLTTRLLGSEARSLVFPPTGSVSSAIGARRWKSKRSSAQFIDPNAAEDDDVPVMKTKGKGSKNLKGAKSKRGNQDEDETEYKTSNRNQELPDEAFDLDSITANMRRAVERCRQTTSTLVGTFGRADPSILDNLRIEGVAGTSGKHPLNEYATVGVRDGMLIVTAYDPDYVKAIEKAIYAADLGLSPQSPTSAEDANVLRVAVPKPTSESRQQMVKDLTKICENARVSIRTARHQGMKQIKSDIDNKVVGKSEGDKETKKLEAETKKIST
ncbi:ribosome recycling factor, partial [Testicularia cyperi]